MAEVQVSSQLEAWDVPNLSLGIMVHSDSSHRSLVAVDLDFGKISIGSVGYLESAKLSLVNRPPSSITVLYKDDKNLSEIQKEIISLVDTVGIKAVVDYVSVDNRSIVSYDQLQEQLEKILEENLDTFAVRDLLEPSFEMRTCLSAMIRAEGLVIKCTDGLPRLSLERMSFENTLFLDNAAVEALQLLENRENKFDYTEFKGASGSRSIEGLIGLHLRTTMGKKRLTTWLLYPLKDLNDILIRQDLLCMFTKCDTIRKMFSIQILRKISDIDKISKVFRLWGSKEDKTSIKGLSLATLMNLYTSIKDTITLKGVLETITEKISDWITIDKDAKEDQMTQSINEWIFRLQQPLKPLSRYLGLIEHSINIEKYTNNPRAAMWDPADYLNESVSPELKQLCQYKRELWKRMETFVDNISNKMMALSKGKSKKESYLKLIRDDKEGFLIRSSKVDHETVKKIIDSDSIRFSRLNKNEYLFTTIDFNDLKEDYVKAKNSIDRQGKSVMTMLIDVACTYAKPVENLSDVIGGIDILCAFAEIVVTSKYPWCRPMLSDSATELHLIEARHALLCERDRMNDKLNIIGNEVRIDREGQRLGLITGPNMGGKSTYIRSAALIVLLAQIGFYVPCREATVPIMDQILCRVGASDAIMRGVSTFMAEMIESSTVCRLATSKSLVLIDELGRGTSTADGFGIACAIAEYLIHTVKCFTFFATHFSEMSSMLKSHGIADHVKALHLTSSIKETSICEDGVVFHYTVAEGVCTKSYGIHVGKLAKLPQILVEDAEYLLKVMEA